MKKTIFIYDLAHSLNYSPEQFRNFLVSNNLAYLLQNTIVEEFEILKVLSVYISEKKFKNTMWEIPEWLTKINTKWSISLLNMYNNPASFPSSLAPSQGKQLFDFIIDSKPENVVEIGSYIGVSSLWIGAALEKNGGGSLSAIDLFLPKIPNLPHHCGFIDDSFAYARNHADAAGLSKFIRFYKVLSWQFARDIRRYIQKDIDFLFIDGDHSVIGCLDDFVTFYPFVREGGKILLHDINPNVCGCPGPSYLLNILSCYPSEFEISYVKTEPDFGMALITKTTKRKNLENLNNFNTKLKILKNHIKTRFLYSDAYQKTLRPHWLNLKNIFSK